ncbi:Stp1/IreP family PP2C-type Ser/Thr phosphatase [Euhalothece natronophila Z-M001]|uniref:Stp1/IreP family PP2C-type Ser/Thr phosphatase n=1 Tax=Euhalothece natronophila Z-M001 TaxID=522448 RepID=A0A5B8NJL1_9CHRO|nr:Stp1/IreP family PP2C-type Ser/Thr phosphatase [Euhalothece natronophila]QDZ38530.1 Stp1/IreP family PP2C-type Ser/Thr phosphatase [Euhalothece natronophila Z-M001]
MKRRFNGHTDTGVMRAVNQDSYYYDPQGRFFIVADGMGGHAGGQEASKIATETISNYLEQYWESDIESETLLKQAVEEANEKILEDQQTHLERAEMGTTVVVVIFRNQKCWCAHVGDSRLYLWRQNELTPLTEDHTWVAWALKSGTISREEAAIHPWRHVLSQCLGRKELYSIDIDFLNIQPGDRLLLCSDGLTGEVSEEEITSYINSMETCEEAVTKLIETAKANGGSDNITVIMVEEGETEASFSAQDGKDTLSSEY